jgi:hypothetical protein
VPDVAFGTYFERLPTLDLRITIRFRA